MARGMIAGRVAAVVLVGVSVTACGQFAGLKAKKHLKDAHGLYQQQDYRKAAAEYEEAIKADPELSQAYFYLGNSYDNLYKAARKGESVNDSYLDEAVKNYERSVEKLANSTEPQEVELRKRSLQYLAAVYASDKKNEPEKAEPVVKRLIDMDPKDTSNYLGLAKIYEDAGQFDKAEEQMKLAEAAAPNSVDVILQLERVLQPARRVRQGDHCLPQGDRARADQPAAFHQHRPALRREDPQGLHGHETAEAGIHQAGHGGRRSSAIEIRPDYFEALTYKNLLLRQQALVEPARSKELIAEADKILKRAIEVRDRQQKGVAE